MEIREPGQLQALLHEHLPSVDQHGEAVEVIGEDFVRLRLPYRPEFVSADVPPGSGQSVMSAPVMMALADTAMYACVHAAYGAAAFGAIVSINTTFLRVAGATDLTATARLLRRGRRMAFFETAIHAADEAAPCSLVTASYTIWQGS